MHPLHQLPDAREVRGWISCVCRRHWRARRRGSTSDGRANERRRTVPAAASAVSRTSHQRRTDFAREYIDERHDVDEQDEVRELIAGTRRRVLTAWEVFLARRRTESSRQTTRRHGRAAASELFPVAVINDDGQVEQKRIEPEFAPWVALALPSALVHLPAYRASLETRIELDRAGSDDPLAIGASAAAARIAVVRGIARALWQLEAIDRERMERLNLAIPSMGTRKIGIPSVRPSVELGDLQLLVRDSERQANHPAKGESSRSGASGGTTPQLSLAAARTASAARAARTGSST